MTNLSFNMFTEMRGLTVTVLLAGPGDPTGGLTWGDVFLNQDRSGLVNPTGAPPYTNNQPLSWSVNNISGTANFYNAEQQVIASYAMAELKLFPQLTLTGGTRFENTNLQVKGGESALFPDPNSDIQQLDLLPAAAATFQLIPEVNLRFAWSQTLARPSFKEMGPVVTQDFSDSQIFIGNPQSYFVFGQQLRPSGPNIFPRAGEVLAFSLFYKDIQKPIEQTIAQSGNTQFFQYINNPNGNPLGGRVRGPQKAGPVPRIPEKFRDQLQLYLHSVRSCSHRRADPQQ